MEEVRSTESSSQNPLGKMPVSAYSEINQAFALAAITYLHVVVSGAHPELPEIAETVSSTIAVLKGLEDPSLLRSTVWPFCITGCLAQEEQQSCFRDLLAAAGITKSSTGTCYEAFTIMEEWWVMRKTHAYNRDWASIMNQRGQHVLLR